MLIAFTLTMPGKGSWDGRWSGEGDLYCLIRSFRGKEKEEQAKELDGQSWSYRWPDSWCAHIEARRVDSREAAKLRRKSKGFCGYDWMVKNICHHGNPTEWVPDDIRGDDVP